MALISEVASSEPRQTVTQTPLPIYGVGNPSLSSFFFMFFLVFRPRQLCIFLSCFVVSLDITISNPFFLQDVS